MHTAKVGGKPWVAQDHRATMDTLKLCFTHEDLKNEVRQKKPPPGEPRTVNGTSIYPARHFA